MKRHQSARKPVDARRIASQPAGSWGLAQFNAEMALLERVESLDVLDGVTTIPQRCQRLRERLLQRYGGHHTAELSDEFRRVYGESL